MSTVWVECWKCDECGWRWIKTETWPERCASSKCRKRSWNKLGAAVPVSSGVKWQIGQIVNLNFKATDCEAGAAGEILPANSTAIGDPIFVKRPSRSRKWNQGALATLAQILTEAGAVPVIDGVRIEPKRNPPPVAIAGSKMNGAMANFLSATIPTHPDSVNIAKDAFLSSTPVGEPIEVKWPLCPKTGFNEQDGETYRCSLAKGHKFNCKPGERVSA